MGFNKCSVFVKIAAFIIAVINLILIKSDSPLLPSSETVDMSKFEAAPSFVEEFNGSELDSSIWKVNYETSPVRHGGYWAWQMAKVYDGALHIKTQYLENGINGSPAGWYTSAIDTSRFFKQKYGYFECRCILPSGSGLWSAFWIYSTSVCDITDEGRNGTEIDVFESTKWHDGKYRNSVQHALHYDGYNEEHQKLELGNYRVGGDPYSEYHTYGVEWNESGYSFYIDGHLTAQSDFGGVSQVPQYLILSVEIAGENGVPEDSWVGASIESNTGGRAFATDFIVDYVKCYRYKQ